MRLLCIDKPRTKIPEQMIPWVTQIGSEYNSTNSEMCADGLYYYLAEMPEFCTYHSELFAILPDNTADEMAEQEKEGIVNIEHQPV